jgi:hypothetical protein
MCSSRKMTVRSGSRAGDVCVRGELVSSYRGTDGDSASKMSRIRPVISIMLRTRGEGFWVAEATPH